MKQTKTVTTFKHCHHVLIYFLVHMEQDIINIVLQLIVYLR